MVNKIVVLCGELAVIFFLVWLCCSSKYVGKYVIGIVCTLLVMETINSWREKKLLKDKGVAVSHFYDKDKNHIFTRLYLADGSVCCEVRIGNEFCINITNADGSKKVKKYAIVEGDAKGVAFVLLSES